MHYDLVVKKIICGPDAFVMIRGIMWLPISVMYLVTSWQSLRTLEPQLYSYLYSAYSVPALLHRLSCRLNIFAIILCFKFKSNTSQPMNESHYLIKGPSLSFELIVSVLFFSLIPSFLWRVSTIFLRSHSFRCAILHAQVLEYDDGSNSLS